MPPGRETLVLADREVRDLVDYPGCIDRLAQAFRELAQGRAQQPLRTVLPLEGHPGLLGMMPGSLTDPSVVGAKVLTVYPGNRGTGRPSHQGLVALFDPVNGSPLALVDATSLTEVRTAAVSALATRTLAREGSHVLAILGAGALAETHVRALPVVRPITTLRVWDRHPERARSLLERLEPGSMATEAAAGPDEAVRGADIVCTVTAAREPILEAEWVEEGAHVNAVGAAVPGARELATSLVRRARVFVDRRESAWAEADDLRVPLAEGAIGRGHVVAELGEVLLGNATGRSSAREVTIFKSVGLAVEDLAAAAYAVERARAEGRGTYIDLSSSGTAVDAPAPPRTGAGHG